HAVVGGQFLFDLTDDDAAVFVQQPLNLLVFQQRIRHIHAQHQVGGAQAAAGKQAGHIPHVPEKVAVLGVPLVGDGIGVVAGGVEELDVQGLPFGLVVDVGLHGAGVVDHGLGAHPLFMADDAPV